MQHVKMWVRVGSVTILNCISPNITMLCVCRQEADSQAASLRSQAAAREERLAAQHASRLAALQSELDARGAAACDSDSALAAARGEITRLTHQVSCLPHINASAGMLCIGLSRHVVLFALLAAVTVLLTNTLMCLFAVPCELMGCLLACLYTADPPCCAAACPCL
jgi:hypothetical protein